MKIILIYGEKDAGKTTTCRRIHDWLKAQGWNQSSYAKIENPADGWFNDFKVKGVHKKKTIAIYSPGDDCGHVREALSFAQELPSCDVLIATIRKGIHYTQPLAAVANSPQHTIISFTLAKGTTISEKSQFEDELANQIICNL